MNQYFFFANIAFGLYAIITTAAILFGVYFKLDGYAMMPAILLVIFARPLILIGYILPFPLALIPKSKLSKKTLVAYAIIFTDIIINYALILSLPIKGSC